MPEYGPAEQHEIEQEAFPGHGPNDNVFHEYTDESGQTVRQYDMDAEVIHADPQWNAMVTAMVEMAQRRVGDQLKYVNVALTRFQANADHQITQFVNEHTPSAEIGWGALVEGLASGLWLALGVEGEVGKLIYEKAVSFITSNIESHLRSAVPPVQHAKEQLEAGVAELITVVGHEVASGIDDLRDEIRDGIERAMDGQEHPSTDPEWVNEMVNWLGFPERSEATVTDPVLQWLDSAFENLLGQVEGQLSDH